MESYIHKLIDEKEIYSQNMATRRKKTFKQQCKKTGPFPKVSTESQENRDTAFQNQKGINRSI